MSTKANAPYKKEQRESKKNTGKVLWVSCIIEDHGWATVKHKVQGTYRRPTNPLRPVAKGKANIKAAKKATHRKGFYAMEKRLARYRNNSLLEGWAQ
jgi:hypothetical protein